MKRVALVIVGILVCGVARGADEFEVEFKSTQTVSHVTETIRVCRENGVFGNAKVPTKETWEYFLQAHKVTTRVSTNPVVDLGPPVVTNWVVVTNQHVRPIVKSDGTSVRILHVTGSKQQIDDAAATLPAGWGLSKKLWYSMLIVGEEYAKQQ